MTAHPLAADRPGPGVGSPLPASATVAVVGAGVMGAGIAQVALVAGHPVALLDVDPGAAAHAAADITRRLDRLLATGRLAAPERDAAVARLVVAEDMSALAPAGLVVEAVAESLPVKRAVFAAVEEVVAADCLLATNTSALSITAIGSALARPGRLVGMHFFNPAPRMPLVEIVSGVATEEAAATAAAATAAAWGKRPVRADSTPGFIVNRVARPFYAQALRALEERAADAATIDAVLRESGGFRMGPLELADLIGHDVNEAVTRSVWEACGYDPRYAPSQRQRALVEAGRLGRKSGHGVYRHGPDVPSPIPVSEPPAAPPSTVRVIGDLGPAAALPELLAGAGVRVAAEPDRSATAGGRARGDGWIELPDRLRLRLCRGRTATAEAADAGAPVVLFDLALDYASAARIALAAADTCPADGLATGVGLFQALGRQVSVIDDTPGMLVARTVVMLVNEAADALGRGVASAADIDAAMRHGVNYPRGPLEWGDLLGPAWVVSVLDALAAQHGDGSHRVGTMLRRRALSGRSLRDG